MPLPRTMSVNEVIDGSPLSRFQLTTIVLCGVVMLLDGFDTQAMGFLAPPISEELGIPLSGFGPVFSAGLFGLMIGAMVSGPIADRWGRRPTIIACCFAFGVFSLATIGASTLTSLIVLRFLTGLGLGGAMPNLVALSSELAPRRLQTKIVTLIFVGMAGGAVLASIVGGALIPLWGWRSVFVVGGVLPIALAVVLIRVLPESVRFLSIKGRDSAKIAAIMRRIAPDVGDGPFAPPPPPPQGAPLRQLFTEGRPFGTLVIWVCFFMNLLILYFILSWLPSLLRQAGMPVSAGITAVLAFSIGGIAGMIMQAPLMKRVGVFPAMVGEFVAMIGLVVLASVVFESFAVMMVVTFALGVVVQGAQVGLNAVTAIFYPIAFRSTGVGWGLGVGRIGSIIGPMIGGLMLSLQWTTQQIFMAGAVPAAIAAAAVVASYQLQGNASPFRPDAEPEPTLVH